MDKEKEDNITMTETTNVKNIDSKLITIHNALLDTTFIPEVSEINENKVKTIKYYLRK